MNRRDFVNRTLAGAGGLLLGGRAAQSNVARAPFEPFERVRLGNSGLESSRVCMGTGMYGGQRQSNHTRMGYRKFEELVRGAYERGVRTFDMADMYGTHGFFSSAMRDLPRDSYSVITKIWFRRGGIPEPERERADVLVERFLKELKTDHIDLLLLHCVVSPEWNVEMREQMDTIAELKERGLVRAHGVSCHTLDALKVCIDEPWVDSVHTRINPYGEKMDGPPEVVVPVLKAIHAKGKGVVGMKIIGEGAFRNSDEMRDNSISFALNLGCVDVLNVGFERLPEVDDFAARVRSVSKTVETG